MLDTFYPPHCVLCGARGRRNRHICPACEADLPINRSACRHCACPLPEGSEHRVCGRCLQQPPDFDAAWSPFLYAQPFEWMIHQFKFNAKLYIGRLIAELAVAHLPADLDRPDCIIPVPLHPRRFRQRGFNQSMELARPFAEALSVRVDTQNCRKVLYTEAQTGKDARQRRRNVRNAFTFYNICNYRHVVLLDDVITTGSTMSELARTIRRQGVQRVDVWSMARAPLNS